MAIAVELGYRTFQAFPRAQATARRLFFFVLLAVTTRGAHRRPDRRHLRPGPARLAAARAHGHDLGHERPGPPDHLVPRPRARVPQGHPPRVRALPADLHHAAQPDEAVGLGLPSVRAGRWSRGLHAADGLLGLVVLAREKQPRRLSRAGPAAAALATAPDARRSSGCPPAAACCSWPSGRGSTNAAGRTGSRCSTRTTTPCTRKLRSQLDGELAMADYAYDKAEEHRHGRLRGRGDPPGGAGLRAWSSARAPDLRRLLAGMAVFSRMVSAMVPVAPLRPRDFKVAQLASLAALNQILHRFLVTARRTLPAPPLRPRTGARDGVAVPGRVHAAHPRHALDGRPRLERDRPRSAATSARSADESLESFRVCLASLAAQGRRLPPLPPHRRSPALVVPAPATQRSCQRGFRFSVKARTPSAASSVASSSVR